MERQVIVQGEARSFAFFNVVIPLNDNERYIITEKDNRARVPKGLRQGMGQ